MLRRRIAFLVLFLPVLLVLGIEARGQACTGTCLTVTDTFPAVVTDNCVPTATTLGTLEHTLVCSYVGGTSCTVVGTIDWTPAIAGTNGPPNCAGPPCATWDCGGSTDSCGPPGCTAYTSCTANTKQSHSYSDSINCFADWVTYHARVKCSAGSAAYGMAQVVFDCGQ